MAVISFFSFAFVLISVAYGLDMDLWNLEYMKEIVGNTYHHKIRRFDKTKPKGISEPSSSYFEETDGFLNMKISDFIDYLKNRFNVQEGDKDSIFSFHPLKSEHEVAIDINNTCLYMIDLDMVKLLAQWYEDFLNTFKLTSVLPGGRHCMMNAVS